MPRIGVSITKNTSFRNSTQEFSNVYYFEATGEPSVSQADTIIDNLTAAEKGFHSTNVNFVRGRLWSAGGGAAANNMISQKQLAGTGARTGALTVLDKERAFLFRLRAGVASNGTPVYLRKWYHACGEFVSGASIPTQVVQNIGSFSAAERTAQQNAMNSIGDGNASPLTLRLCSKSGRLPDAGATWSAHAFLEHHQFGDQWRAL